MTFGNDKQQELERAIIKAEKLAILGQLAAGVLHEIKNPLTTISGFLQLLHKELKGTQKEEYVRIALAELEHANKLLDEFLQMARPGFSNRQRCSIVGLIKEVYILAESEALLRQVEIKHESIGDIPHILGDAEQLKQVFLNLIRNAFEALSPGGRILMQASWYEKENHVRVTVSDTGAGMDDKIISSMFNPLFTTKDTGTGLGMFISKKIIDNHRGHIEVESKPGKGTSITILLPLE